MSAVGVWAGLGESVFLAGVGDRERDPARIPVAVLGGLAVAALASFCAILIVTVAYALFLGEGSRGLEGLADAWSALTDPRLASSVLSVLRLIMTTVLDAIFWVAFVAFAAAVAHQPLHVYLTVAAQIRWRLVVVSFALSTAAIAPAVMIDRLADTSPVSPPFLSVSPFLGDRLAYVLSSLMLIPAAAAEEVFFRGWMLRQVGAFLRRPALLIGLNGIVFATLHFDFTPEAFLTRALMGASFAYMTLRLGGVEFAAGAHAVNNIMIVLFIQPLSYAQASGGDVSAFSIFEDLALIGGYVLITELTARLPALRRLAGLRPEEISSSRGVSAKFG